MPSEIRSIGPTIRRLAKGTIDLVRWRAPVQLLKYATRTVWFKNVNTGYPVGAAAHSYAKPPGQHPPSASRVPRGITCGDIRTEENVSGASGKNTNTAVPYTLHK